MPCFHIKFHLIVSHSNSLVWDNCIIYKHKNTEERFDNMLTSLAVYNITYTHVQYITELLPVDQVCQSTPLLCKNPHLIFCLGHYTLLQHCFLAGIAFFVLPFFQQLCFCKSSEHSAIAHHLCLCLLWLWHGNLMLWLFRLIN